MVSYQSLAEINTKQKIVIKRQLFLLHEGMITKEAVFEKAKLFDDKGVFGIGEDKMSESEFEKFLENEALNSEN